MSKKNISDKEKKAYQQFKLKWMLDHGWTLEDLISELSEQMRDSSGEESLEEIFKMWEEDAGFGGSIWPCFDEYVDCEKNESEEEQPFGVVRWYNDDIAEALSKRNIAVSDEAISIVRTACENNHHFTDSMIETGWETIDYYISGVEEEIRSAHNEIVVNKVKEALKQYGSDVVDVVWNEDTGYIDIMQCHGSWSDVIFADVVPSDNIDKASLEIQLNALGVGYVF